MRREFAIFDVASDMAHFRRQYAITTALTYVLPPRTALCGLIGAVLGLPKNDSLSSFQDREAVFGIQIVEPIRTGHVSINLLDTKGSPDFRPKAVNPHTTMRYEIVSSPRYRIMFSHAKLAQQLATSLQRGESRYTPCLGLAWMVAWFPDACRTVDVELIEGDNEVRSFVSPVRADDLVADVQWNADSVYQRLRMPAEMQPDRLVTRYEQYIIDTTGHPIETALKVYWRLPDDTCFSAM
ncbi:MAG: type I-B CRISPR-associated protein Cas5 [Acidobacteria bacterium]|nr:type I-B CRISPR-associated protein Cas5 [Acidobacteriota bacterium]